MSNDSRRKLVDELVSANRAYQRAVDEMDEAVARATGLNRSDMRCVDILEEHGPMRAGELAAAAGLSPGAVTALIDRLERENYVTRIDDPADRRRVLVAITDWARESNWEYYGPLAESATALNKLTVAQLETIRDFLRFGADRNTEHAARVRALPPRASTRRRGPARTDPAS